MIKRIVIQDFFSFKGKTEIDLNPGVNLLLGINGSGKTSFLNAFKLLYEGVSGVGFESVFQEQWGGFDEVVNATSRRAPYIKLTYVFDPLLLRKINPSSPFDADVSYEINISPSGSTGYSIREKLYAPKRGKNSEQFTYLEFKNGAGRISTRDSKGNVNFSSDYKDGELSGRELVLRQITDPARHLPCHTIKKAIDNMAIYGYFDTSSSSDLRRPSEYSSSTRLKRTGDNLAQLLNYFKNNRTLTYNEIEQELTTINPAYMSIEFSNLGGRLYLALREKNLDKTIGALHLSDGTLRYLLNMTIYKNDARGYFIGLDEPECGLHPDMIKAICDMIKKAAKESQIVLASHSPLLFNHFELDDILVFSKNSENSTVVDRVNESDFEDWKGEFLPGQMWLRGQIGGKRW